MISALVFNSSGPLVPLMFSGIFSPVTFVQQTIIGRGGVLYQLSEGADVFVSGARNIQAGRSEIEFVGRHGFRCIHHVLFILAYLAVHH